MFDNAVYSKLKGRFAVLAVILVAACAAPPPPAPPPPPPVAVYIPPPVMPTPPMGAASFMTIPQIRADGLRATPNRDLEPSEILWHFRSAFNVAALNCQDPIYFRMADDYNLFLSTHRRALDSANRAIEAKFRSEHGSDYKRIRDTFMTQVYNFFSLPPVKDEFCQTAFALALESTAIPSSDVEAFASRALPQLEGVFDQFFTAYEQYNRDLAEWMILYGPREQQPAYPAVYGEQTDGNAPVQPQGFGPQAPLLPGYNGIQPAQIQTAPQIQSQTQSQSQPSVQSGGIR